jgi:pilus assembly protein TadC
MKTLTTEAQRHGENMSFQCLKASSITNFMRRRKRGSERFVVFSVSLCLRGGIAL